MGAQLVAYYQEAFEFGGYPARVELARLTRVPSTQAEEAEDSPELIDQFRDALNKLKLSAQSRTESRTGNLDTAMAQVKLRVLRPRLPFEVAVQRVTEAAAKALQVERSSVWLLNRARDAISLKDLYSAKDTEHSTGIDLRASNFPAYFAALNTERTIAADDAHRDPRTCEFSSLYLAPLGISSMLDVPIWTRGTMYGVLCNEHTGRRRHWTSAEEDFAYSAGSLVGLLMEI